MGRSTFSVAGRRPVAVALCVAAAFAASFALTACGQSKQDKARNTVCDAKSAIATKVDDLRSLPPTAASIPAAKNDVTAIVDELKKIQGAQGDLSPDRKQQVETANKQFSASVQSVATELSRTLNVNTAKTQLEAAVRQLVSSYEQAFTPVRC